MKKITLIFVFLLMSVVSFTIAASNNVRGDVDGDGRVNIDDVTSLINYLLTGNSSLIVLDNADVYPDGRISIDDITSLINYLLSGAWPEVSHDYVDLGLPSGTLWATCNIGANSPEDYGDYFAWGETAPKDNYEWSNYKWCNGSMYSLTKYCTDSNFGIVDNKTKLDPEDDAANVNWGPSWHIPTLEQMQELLNNCTCEWTSRNGVNGYQVTAPNGNSLFLPATLYASEAYYWSGSLSSGESRNAYNLKFYRSKKPCLSEDDRAYGFCVRAVREPEENHEYVDLGLPSGTLWATCNIGANSPEDYGDYFAWGETATKEQYDWTTYKWCMGSNTTMTKYCSNSDYGANGFVDNKWSLDLEDDAAYVNWGPSWRMPSQAHMNELRVSCTWEWTTQNGVNGYLVTGPNGASLFLPAAGWRDSSLLKGTGKYGQYWSSTLNVGGPNCHAFLLGYDSSSWYDVYISYRDRGCTVRPIRASQN